MSDEWYTPWNIVQPLADEFANGKFDLDPCTVPEVAKGRVYYTMEDDGLIQPWFGTVWLNPPYSKPGPWIDKAVDEINSGNCELVVALMLGNNGNRWHNKAMVNATLMRYYPRRLRFESPDGNILPAKWGNVLFVFGKLPGRHPTVALNCVICNTVFWKRAGAKTCSDACRMALSRKNL